MCVCVCFCVCVRAHSHLCIGLFLCSLRSTLGQTQQTTAATRCQTPTTGERGSAAGAALLTLVQIKYNEVKKDLRSFMSYNCALPPPPTSLKKSSAELKRILSNGQVSSFFTGGHCLCCLRDHLRMSFRCFVTSVENFRGTKATAVRSPPPPRSPSCSTQEHTSTPRAASVSRRQLNSQLLRFTAVTQLTNRAVLALLLPLIHS